MLAEERALTSGALWTEPRIGDWRQPGTPLRSFTPRRRRTPIGAAGRVCHRPLLRQHTPNSVPAVCREVKPVGKPDAGNPHVRFDERGRETERCRMAQATAPVLDSTCAPRYTTFSGKRLTGA